MQAVGASGQDRLPRGKHASKLTGTAGGRPDSGLVEMRSLPELRHKEPGPDFSIWTRSGHSPGGARRSSAGRHRRDAPELDALRASSVRGHDAPTAPIPRLSSEAVMRGVTGHPQTTGLEVLLSLSMLVQDVPATADLQPGLSEPATAWAQERLAAMPLPRSPRDAVRPAMNIAIASQNHEERFSRATVAQDLESDRVEKEIRDAVSYEKGLAVKGLVSIALVIAVLVARVHFFG
jgi:hypothetical protein